jgi:hypothetical protein
MNIETNEESNVTKMCGNFVLKSVMQSLSVVLIAVCT